MQPTLPNIEQCEIAPDGHDLPDGWKWVRFGTIATIGSRQVSPLEEPYKHYIHIGPENIESETGRLLNLRTAEAEELISGKYLFDQHAIVYSKIRPNLNKVCTPDFIGICSADAYPIWPDTNIITKHYLAEYMKAALFVKQTVATSMRSGMPKVNRDDLVRVWVALPPIKEQNALACFLNDWQKAANSTEKLIETKNRYKTALAEQLLKGQRRFPEFSGEWQEVEIGNLFTEIERPVVWDDEEFYNLISIRRRSEGLFFRGETQGKTIKTKTLKTTRTNDFLISRMQVVHGAWGRVGEDFDGYHVSDSYTTLVPKSEAQIDVRFFDMLSRTPFLYRLARISSHGVHIEKMTFNIDLFLEKKILIPRTLKEQRKIAEVLGLLDEEIALLRRELEALKRQKQGLMRQLLTGKVRVKEFAR